MRTRLLTSLVLAVLVVSMTGTTQYLHLHQAHEHHPPHSTGDPHSDCSICKNLSGLKVIIIDLPTLGYQLAPTNVSSTTQKFSVSVFNAVSIPLPRPPPTTTC